MYDFLARGQLLAGSGKPTGTRSLAVEAVFLHIWGSATVKSMVWWSADRLQSVAVIAAPISAVLSPLRNSAYIMPLNEVLMATNDHHLVYFAELTILMGLRIIVTQFALILQYFQFMIYLLMNGEEEDISGYVGPSVKFVKVPQVWILRHLVQAPPHPALQGGVHCESARRPGCGCGVPRCTCPLTCMTQL